MLKPAVLLLTSGLLLAALCVASGIDCANANFVPYSIVTIHSPTNQTTYNSEGIALAFSVIFSMSGNKTVAYSIDGGDNITVAGLQYTGDIGWEISNGTVTLPVLQNGQHKIEMFTPTYLNPELAHSVVYFTVDNEVVPASTSTATADPSPMQPLEKRFCDVDYNLMVTAVSVLATIFLLGTLFLFRRRRKVNKPTVSLLAEK